MIFLDSNYLDENPLKFDNLTQSPSLMTAVSLEKKSPLKTQRMINLEKQLHETKELVKKILFSLILILFPKVNQYKNKIESLKTLITTNPSSTQTTFKMEEGEKFENTEYFKHHKEIIKQEVLDQVTNKKGGDGLTSSELSPKNSNTKLVKPIKGGGQSKNSWPKSNSGILDKDSKDNKDKKPPTNQKFFDVLKQQYRYNRTVMGSIGEGVLNKNKTQSGIPSKNQLETKSKAT